MIDDTRVGIIGGTIGGIGDGIIGSIIGVVLEVVSLICIIMNESHLTHWQQIICDCCTNIDVLRPILCTWEAVWIEGQLKIMRRN